MAEATQQAQQPEEEGAGDKTPAPDAKGKKGKKTNTDNLAREAATAEQIASFNAELVKEGGAKITLGENFKDSNLKSISTGSIKLDLILKIPFIEGSVVEYFGENQVGKTTFALEAAANAIRMGKPVYYFDLERKLREAQVNMVKGIDKKMFTVIRPDDGEEAVNMVKKCVTQVPGCFIVFDSLSALMPEVEGAEGAEKQTMGLVARLAWKMVRSILGPAERNKCTLLFISHITANLNPYASGDTTKGGKAIPDMAAQRIRLSRKMSGIIEDKDGNKIGQTVTCRVIKNNVNRPFLEVEVPILYGFGIDRVGDLLGAAVDYGIVEKAGGWLSYADKKYREEGLRELIETDKVVRDDMRKKIREIFED